VTEVSKEYPFKFSLVSDPAMFEFTSFTPGVNERISIQDSIFNYFPYLDLVVVDDSTIFTEDNFFVENLKLKFKLSDRTEKLKMYHDFYWSEYQINQIASREIVTGAVMYPCRSNFWKQDEFKSKSYRGEASSIVFKIMNQYRFPEGVPKLNISTTTNFDTWGQNGFDYNLIRTLAKYSASSLYPNSPFITFINSRSEFNFKTLKELFNQKPVQTLYFGQQEDITPFDKDTRNDVIQNFSFQSLGSPFNFKNLNSEVYSISDTGSYNVKEVSFKDKLKDNKIGQNKINIREEDLIKIRSNKNFGIIDSSTQKQMYTGWLNNEYLDSLLSFRMSIELNLNLNICSGDTVDLKFLSPNSEKDNKATEYSGKWLVLESGHTIVGNGQASTVLNVGKSSLKFYKKHKFFRDFI
jgi:hypothetical protein